MNERKLHTPAAFNLDGKLAIVTGASSGIGRAVCQMFAAAGADVVLVARRRALLREVAAEVRQYGRTAFTVGCDLADRSQRVGIFDRLPPADILVNSAGVNIPLPFHDITEDVYDRLFGVNVEALYFTTQMVVNLMRASAKGGTVVNISSQAGHVGLPDRTVYCATKHAVEGLTKALAVELAPDIRVNAVAPTFVETEMTRAGLQRPSFSRYVSSNILLSGLPTVEDVANAVLYAASPASRFLTGSSIRVDGGWTAH